MKFDDLRHPDGELPQNVSEVYANIYERVEGHSSPENTKLIVFCLAYALYSSRKKTEISEIVSDGNPDKVSIPKVHQSYNKDWNIKNLIDESSDSLTDYTNDLLHHVFSDTIDKLIVRKNVRYWLLKIPNFIWEIIKHAIVLLLGFILLAESAKLLYNISPSLETGIYHYLHELGKIFQPIRDSSGVGH